MNKKILQLCFLLLLCACSNKSTTTNEKRHTVPAPQDVMMYQINPRLFAPQHAFNAVAQQLDSIKELGANVVWFMPINEVGKVNSVNSPYCVKDYKALNPEFGTTEEFQQLITLCHEKGMSVIMDWVPNHTSWDNAWIANRDWYTQDEEGEIISPAGTGWLDVADLNFDNAEMRLAMIDAMKYWVEEVGVDGFRVDAVDFVPFDFLKQAVDSLRAMPQELLLLAEGKRRDHFDAGFDMNYSWDFLESLRDLFLNDEDADRLFEVNHSEYDSIPEGKVKLRFTTNHDEYMKMSVIEEFHGERGAMAAFVPTVFLRGGALIYSGQEVAYPQRIDFFRYVAVDWSANPAIRNEYKQLMQLYNRYPALRKGKLETYPDKDILLFEKYDNNHHFLVAVNVRDEVKKIGIPEGWTGQKCTDQMSGEEVQIGGVLELAPYQYRIFRH